MKKAKSQKQLQVAENFKRILSQFFLEEEALKFKGCHITISEADISPDLKNIKFYINIFGQEASHPLIINHLNKITPFFKKKIAKEINIRSIPVIKFINDDTTKKSSRINELLETQKPK